MQEILITIAVQALGAALVALVTGLVNRFANRAVAVAPPA
jgi:hypothetical protein